MRKPQSVEEISFRDETVRQGLERQAVSDLEGIDRLYHLNLYQPMRQSGGGIAAFFWGLGQAQVVSTSPSGRPPFSPGPWASCD